MTEYGADWLAGSCRVNGANGDTSTAPYYRQGIVASVTRTGPGAYTVTLNQPLARDRCGRSGQCMQAVARQIHIGWVNDTRIDVVMGSSGAGDGDADFSLEVRRINT